MSDYQTSPSKSVLLSAARVLIDSERGRMPRCATCRHWEREEPYCRELSVNRCMRVVEWWDATIWNDSGDRVLTPEAEGILAFANDASSYAATLLTLGEFGCVMHERGGRTVAMPMQDVDMNAMHKAMFARVEVGTTLHTDEATVYKGLGGLFFAHETVNHSAGEFARGDVTTNGVESVFAVLKRGIMGVYHHTSKKHLHRYVNEFTFRLDAGNVRRHTMERLDSFIGGTAGNRLSYKALVQ